MKYSEAPGRSVIRAARMPPVQDSASARRRPTSSFATCSSIVEPSVLNVSLRWRETSPSRTCSATVVASSR